MAAARSEEATQDLVIVSRGPARAGQVQIGSMRTNSIVGKVDVEIIENGVFVVVHRLDKSQIGPVSMVVV